MDMRTPLECGKINAKIALREYASLLAKAYFTSLYDVLAS